jgi:hypothetical protein
VGDGVGSVGGHGIDGVGGAVGVLVEGECAHPATRTITRATTATYARKFRWRAVGTIVRLMCSECSSMVVLRRPGIHGQTARLPQPDSRWQLSPGDVYGCSRYRPIATRPRIMAKQ